ncbi:L-seryl-tRNA(Sec) selenium transferase [hydrothermal vent metagenome]|uniref:L-seryl-tRNA(Sec) selenium transferase n=1 Tax=hydrothermal vent metagenome TaxID=652676 RepID=A0A1W1EFU2_9ZZZZ
MSKNTPQKNNLLKNIPKIDKILEHSSFEGLSLKVLLPILREEINSLRENILNEKCVEIDENFLISSIIKKYHDVMTPTLQKVINATGVIVHTNLGRSLINPKSFDNAKEVATSYNTLEFDMQKGKRGERYSHLSKIFTKLLDCEDVLVVNNNASAVFLILNTFAKQKEVIVSRGELVEIGGSFRIPEVMSNSGANLVEVGATNKTHLRDYENNINEETKMLMKVHKSNYTIEGFTAEVEFSDIAKLAKEKNIIDYYDLGSGHLVDLPYGLSNTEPSLKEIMKDEPSLLSFSGDKLFGSVQAGIIVGKKELIAKLKKNQLLRMLRVDKLTLSILTEDIKSYLLNEQHNIPTLNMLFKDVDELKVNAKTLVDDITDIVKCEIIETTTLIGGGSTPNKKIPSIAVTIQIKEYSASKLQNMFRKKNIIGRIEDDTFILDFRTIQINDISYIKESIECLATL